MYHEKIKSCYFHYNEDLNKFFFSDCEKLIEYSASAASVVLSDPCVCPLPRIKIYLFLLSACTDELISTPKLITFLPQSKFRIEKRERESNPIPYPEYESLLGSAFLVVSKFPNKQSFRVNLACKSCDHLHNS